LKYLRLKLAALCMATSTSAMACSDETPCVIGDREYYIAMPDGQDGPAPAVVYLHGAGGTGAGSLRNTGMVSGYLDRGFAVIAPTGSPRDDRSGRFWNFHPSTQRQEVEIDFLEQVRDDAVSRFDLNGDQIVLTGFSIGGSMAAYTACLRPESFSAYAPVGGNFWRPHPVSCEGPVQMLHTHGWTDGTVPLEGRAFGNASISDPNVRAQGDVFHAMLLWRETNGCNFGKADRFEMDENYWRRIWDRCTPGSALELALFPGGHRVPETWPDLVVDWYEGL